MIKYIIKALLNDDSISVNDLGTFSKHYQSARFEGETLLPPQYVVSLKMDDDQPDGTEFINFICREKQCRITEAAMEISRWVEELKTALENNKSISFDDFGTFSLTDKGAIQFTCDHIADLNREFEGMEIVQLGKEALEVKADNEQEAEERRLQEEAEQRLREAEEQERLAKEAEERRLQEEAEQRLREAEEQERLAKEAEERRLQEEAEQRLREAEEQKRLAKEAEERRLQEEAEQRLRDAEEQERLAKEAEERRLQEEAEQRLREAEEQQKMEEEVQKEQEVKLVDKGADTHKDDNMPTDGKKHRSLWWLFLLLILIALGVLGYLFRKPLVDTFYKVKDKIMQPKEAVIPEEEPALEPDTIAYEETSVEDTVAEPEAYTPEVIRKTADNQYDCIRFESGHYYVIAGSFPTEQDAERHIRQRNLNQYAPSLVMQDGVSNLRVCIGIYDTEEEAEAYAKSINPKYWVLK